MKYQIVIEGSLGYGADQVKGTTVEDLRYMLEGLNDTDEIVLYDTNNGYGAQFGRLTDHIEDAADEDEE